MDTKLETLLAIMETNNFTRAAEKLSLTQPAVSHHISQLEEELDTKIFIRKKNDLILTKEGEIVVKYARRIQSLYTKMRAGIHDQKNQINHITIGITHTSESSSIAEGLAIYSSKNEGVNITIISDSINNLYEKLKNYEIDLAIVEGKINDPKLNTQLLDTDNLVCVVSNENKLSKKSYVTINDLKKEKMILRLPGSATRNLFESHLQSNNMSIDDFNVILEVDNIATIKDLIRKDMGVSILAKSACVNEWRKGKITLLPIENLSMIREINILYHKDFGHQDFLKELTSIYNANIRKNNY